MLPGLLLAAGIDFSASVDQTTVGLGEQFTLTVNVQGEDMASVPKPQLPDLPDFNVLGNSSSQSTSFQIINGKMSKQASVNFIYYLSAKKTGKLTLGPCILKYNGQEYQSQDINIEVTKSAQARPQQSGQSPKASHARIPLDGNLYLSVYCNKKTIYLGEQVNVEFVLYNRFQINGLNLAEQPSFGGFWTENIYDAQKIEFKRQTVDGKQFDVFLLKKTALFPMTSGQLEIKPMALNVEIVQRSRDIFDFFGTTQNVKVESKPIHLTVLPLPENGKPAEFTGGVGSFAMTAELDRSSTTGSELINLTIKVSGAGNIRLIEKPVIPATTGLKILDPEIKDQVQTSGDVIKGSKSFRYPIIPQADGKYVLPAIKMAYFDPGDKSYHTLQSKVLECTASGCTPNAPLVEATGLKVLGADINYLKPDRTEIRPFKSSPWWLLGSGYFISFALRGFSFLYRAHRNKLDSDRGYARKYKSGALVKKRLKAAVRLLKDNPDQEFYASLFHAVLGYVGDRCNLDTHALSKEQLKAELLRLNLTPDLADKIIEMVEQCDIARFSPDQAAYKTPRDLFDRSREILNQL
ncbi:protein BatD [candidate division TA06 bacterium]|uniref:Protein BatD n=1 Tax=candidate division TA06 bacterium TaxID=2250710 RepID=A0A933I961_UNCT6|nr:protein BatD [candidate division TA06 bacterium]